MKDFSTLEEAKAEILRLEELNQQITQEKETLSQDNEKLTGELNTVRTLNQQYFLKLRAQNPQESKKDTDEEEAPSCEDFARTLNIF